MKITEDGIVYFVDECKRFATVESFQDVFFEDVHIPAMVQGYVVKQICSRAFNQNKYIKFVFLPDTITHINAEAFCECYFLEQVHFYRVTNKFRDLSIGYRAFAACPKLKHITSEGEISVSCEKFAFLNCIRLATFELYLDRLENNCFENCFDLNNVTFAENALWKTNTFKGCGDLKNITFLADVEELLSDTCMNWISKRKIRCKKNTSVAEFVYTGTHVEFI